MSACGPSRETMVTLQYLGSFFYPILKAAFRKKKLFCLGTLALGQLFTACSWLRFLASLSSRTGCAIQNETNRHASMFCSSVRCICHQGLGKPVHFKDAGHMLVRFKLVNFHGAFTESGAHLLRH